MPRHRYTAVVWDYDTVLEQGEYPPWLICLSATSKMILLNVCETIDWKTRWIGDANQEVITQWKENVMAELILGTCLDDFCAAVTTAIEDCSDVQAALSVFMGGIGGTHDIGDPSNALPISQRKDNLLPDDYVCDPDHRFGMAVALVGSIHEATSDSFEKIELATDPLELIAEIADNFPAVGWIATAFDVINWLQDSAYDMYDAAYSQTVADEIACQIFCAMVKYGECYLSIQTLIDVYTDFEVPSSPPGWDAPLSEWLNWLITIPAAVAIDTVKASSMLGLICMGYGGAFNEFVMGHRSLQTVIGLAADDENSDHSVLCDVCPPSDPREVNFESILEDMSYVIQWGIILEYGAGAPSPTHVCKSEYIEHGGGSYSSRNIILADLNDELTITRVRFKYYPVHSINFRRRIILYDAEMNVVDTWTDTATKSAAWYQIDENFNDVARYIRVEVSKDGYETPQFYYAYIDQIIVTAS